MTFYENFAPSTDHTCEIPECPSCLVGLGLVAEEPTRQDAGQPKRDVYRWPQHVKLAARRLLGTRTLSDDNVRSAIDTLAAHFPEEMAPVLAKHDGGVGALRQRITHMSLRGYESENPDNWENLADVEAVLEESGWPL